MELCKSAGMDGYVSKPVRRSELLGQIEMYLAAVMNTVQADAAATTRSAERSEPVLDSEVFDELRFLHGDDHEGFESLIREYINSTSQAIAELRTAVTNRNAPDIQRISHSIKGASAQLGGVRLAATCSGLEQQAKANDVSGSDSQMDELEEDFRRSMASSAVNSHLRPPTKPRQPSCPPPP